MVDPGGPPQPPTPSLFLDQAEAEWPEKIFLRPGAPSSQGLWPGLTPPPPPYLKVWINHSANITTLTLFRPEGVRSSPQRIITSTVIYFLSSLSTLLNTHQILNYDCLDFYGFKQNSV